MPTKILVVDDEIAIRPLMQQRFRRQIQEGTYSFQFAHSGQEALARIQEDADQDVLLLDINMPDMDGLSLLAQVSDQLPNSRAVMVSAYGDIQNIRTAMNQGAFDFVTKPINFQDLELTIEKTTRYINQLRDSIRSKAVADMKARFFDNITHEFRTPLSLIMAPLETMLGEDCHSVVTRQNLTMIRRNANQLLELINQLLDLAKLETGTLPLVEAQGDVVAFVKRIVDVFQPLAVQKNLSLIWLTDCATLEARFDDDKWGKIILNLLSNALKFTPAGGSVTVNLICPTDSTIRLTIKDTGIGIAPEHLTRIFDRFYQVSSSLTRTHEGSGIGMSLAKELVQLLGGTIEVESSLAKPSTGHVSSEGGTSFTVELPLQRVESDPAEQALRQWSLGDVHPVSQALLTNDEHEPATDQPLLLIVEDNIELLNFIAGALSDQYHVLTATNGREGLALAQRELPDIVVSDLMMPEMDGYELTRQLKANATTDHIAVVLLTARAAQQHRLEGLTWGADDYLTKPFDLKELQLRLHNITRRQQTLREFYKRQFHSVESSPANPSEPSAQDLFMKKVYSIIETHLDDSTFRAELLADEVAMSTRTLTRKLTMMAGESPARLIRLYRLKRATDLLRTGRPVAETAYMVGFEHPAHFTTVFKDTYGQTPTEFIANRH